MFVGIVARRIRGSQVCRIQPRSKNGCLKDCNGIAERQGLAGQGGDIRDEAEEVDQRMAKAMGCRTHFNGDREVSSSIRSGNKQHKDAPVSRGQES